MSPHDQDLRTTLHRLADAAEPLPVDADLWRRARAARRRGQALAVAAVLAIVVSVGGAAALWSLPDREARTASSEVVAGGAIPTRVVDPGELPPESAPSIEQASVAFVSAAGQAVVVDAADGSYHALDLPDGPTDPTLLVLSPDGRHLAWATVGRIHVWSFDQPGPALFAPDDQHADVSRLAFTPSSTTLLWNGTDARGQDSGGVLPVRTPVDQPLRVTALRGIPSPTDDLVAVASEGRVRAAGFVRPRGRTIDRDLPPDLYPEGATVRPIGWATDSLVVAELDAPAGSYVEGRHLVLFTAPSEPASRWTFRILLRDVPQQPSDLSVAVDLVPDLDGTSSQQLTHDFTADAPVALGLARPAAGVLLGVSALLALAVAAAAVRRRRLRW